MSTAVTAGTYVAYGQQATEGTKATIAKHVPIAGEDVRLNKNNLESKAYRKGYKPFIKYGPNWSSGPVTIESPYESREEWLAALMGGYDFTDPADGSFVHKFIYKDGLPDEPVGITLQIPRDLSGTDEGFDYVDMLPTQMELQMDPEEMLREVWTFHGGGESFSTPVDPTTLTQTTEEGIVSNDNTVFLIWGGTGFCMKQGTIRFINMRDEARVCYGTKDYRRALNIGGLAVEFSGDFELANEGTPSSLDTYKEWSQETDTNNPGLFSLIWEGSEITGGINHQLVVQVPKMKITGGTPTAGEAEGIITIPFEGQAVVTDPADLPFIQLKNSIATKQNAAT